MTVMRQEIKKVKVQSLANGNMLIEPTYWRKPLEKGATPVGVLTRISIAAEIQKLLDKELK